MEGLPKLPMLSIEPRQCAGPVEFLPKLREGIIKKYQEDPSRFQSAIERLEVLREEAIGVTGNVTSVKTMKQYYSQLYLLKSRFNMESGDHLAVFFSWFDKFSESASPSTFDDINYELVSVLHNIGAAHSMLGTLENRSTPEGMKGACTHFQHALFAFNKLKRDSASRFSADFADSILQFYATLMEAQAQECILEKSMVDNRKEVIVAKVANQVSDLYHGATKVVENRELADIVGSSRAKDWKKFTEMKAKFYCAIAKLYMGQDSSLRKMYGERVGWFQAAESELEAAAKLATKESDIQDSFQFARDVIVGKLTNAKKENDFIYHERVPGLDALPVVAKVLLVKGIPFDPLDAEIGGPDLFAALVPGKVHLANSVYSEEKAQLLRKVDQRVMEHNDSLNEFLSRMNMDSLHLESEFLLPDSLLERSSSFNAQPEALPTLLSSLQRLTGCYRETEGKLGEFQKKLLEAEQNLSSLQAGSKGERMGNLLSDLRDSLDQYSRAHSQATHSNTELQKAVAFHSENLKILALPLPQLKATLPSVPKQKSPAEEELVRLMGKVEEMRSQRSMLMQELRNDMNSDDLTKRLLAQGDAGVEELFAKELEKFNKKIAVIDQNLAAQDNILAAFTAANAKYAETRKATTAAIKERESQIEALIASYDAYVGVLGKAERGRLFYDKLLTALREFEQQLDTLEESVEEVRREMEARRPPPPAPSVKETPPAPPRERPSGPRLGDYMEYYRAKQMGHGVAPPSTPNTAQSAAPPVSPNVAGEKEENFANKGQLIDLETDAGVEKVSRSMLYPKL